MLALVKDVASSGIATGLSVFLGGGLIRTVTDTAFTSGEIGLFTANKSFELDEFRVGDPSDRCPDVTTRPHVSSHGRLPDPA